MQRAALLLPLLASLLTTACVTKAHHDATLRDLVATEAEADQANRRLVKMQAQSDRQGARIASLETLVADREAELAKLGEEKAVLGQKLAANELQLATLEARATLAERGLATFVRTRSGLKATVERLTEGLAQVAARQLAAEARVAEYRDMLAKFRPLIDAGTLDVRIVDGRMMLTMPMDILFTSGSARLSTSGKDSLGEVGVALASIPKRFQVEGHTDNVPIHNEHYASNWELASARSLVVVHALLDAGVRPTQLSGASFSEFSPRAANDDLAGRALNRRIEIVIAPDLSGLPGTEELERLDAEVSR
jgi:chemotaxis protein MotB